MWSQIEQWWIQRTQREQGLLITAAGLLIALLFYLALWRPLHIEHERVHKRLRAAQQQWQWLNEQIAQHPKLLQHPPPRWTAARLAQWLDALNRSLGLNARIQHEGARVVLQLEAAPPAAVAGLLNRLQAQVVQVLELALTQDGGRVKARIEVAP